MTGHGLAAGTPEASQRGAIPHPPVLDDETSGPGPRRLPIIAPPQSIPEATPGHLMYPQRPSTGAGGAGNRQSHPFVTVAWPTAAIRSFPLLAGTPGHAQDTTRRVPLPSPTPFDARWTPISARQIRQPGILGGAGRQCVRLLPALPGYEREVWPARTLCLEAGFRLPWRGRRHPVLDCLVETPSALIGIESKQFKPFRSRRPSCDSWRRSAEPRRPHVFCPAGSTGKVRCNRPGSSGRVRRIRNVRRS